MPQIQIEAFIKLGIYLFAFVFAHWPSNWMIRKIIKGWNPDKDEPTDNMGAFIGTLERILIILLIGIDSNAAIGFVVAMKSIARYDRMQKEKAFAEYFLAGTLLSMLIALILGLIVRRSAASF